ncbi:Rrf2 family transcriptional regulator, partial [Candidatus Sumerlaeota bacterium]|nr:Rrf2 family transcriptional regulator [Candidatus Sumerlaeota bacterium]
RRGAHGGVELARPPERITMLAIVEACQGLMAGNYCRAIGDKAGPVCGFHQAMLDVHLATKLALARWTLKDLAARPQPTGPLKGNMECRMNFMQCALNQRSAVKPRARILHKG